MENNRHIQAETAINVPPLRRLKTEFDLLDFSEKWSSDVLTLPELRSSFARAIDAESPHGSCKDRHEFEEKPPQTLYIGGATLADMFMKPYSLSWTNDFAKSQFLDSLTIYRFRELKILKSTDPRLE